MCMSDKLHLARPFPLSRFDKLYLSYKQESGKAPASQAGGKGLAGQAGGKGLACQAGERV